MPKIRTILFDMDGVLVNAKDWHFEALNAALAAHGYLPISYPDHIAHYDGLPTRKKLELIAKAQNIPPEELEAINASKQRFTIEITEKKCVPSAEHVATLGRLKKDNYSMALCSNSVRASVDLMMTKTGLMPFFAFTLSNEDVQYPKPHPEMYLTAMDRLGIKPSESLILEDNINGIQAARASGGYVLEIKNIREVNYEHIMRAISVIESQ